MFMSIRRLVRSRKNVRRVVAVAIAAAVVLGFALAPTNVGLTKVSSSYLIHENFALPNAASDFTVVTGGSWVSGGNEFVLQNAANSALPNSNVVVDNTPVSGNWDAVTRLSDEKTQPGADNYSFIFGYTSLSNYYYANFSQAPAAGEQGLY